MCLNKWSPSCRSWSTCPGARDGAGLPLLPFVWGGSATDGGVYRSMIGADVFFKEGAPPTWQTLPKPPLGQQETAPFGAWRSLSVGPVQEG